MRTGQLEEEVMRRLFRDVVLGVVIAVTIVAGTLMITARWTTATVQTASLPSPMFFVPK